MSLPTNFFIGRGGTPEEPLFSFSQVTFNTGGQNNNYTPQNNITNYRNDYVTQTGQSYWNDNAYFQMSYDGIQEFKVPSTGTYEMRVRGAHGLLNNGQINGRGASITVRTRLNQNDILYIAVGQVGAAAYSGAGGGATYVAVNNTTQAFSQHYTANSQLLVVAGGGGGSSHNGVQSPPSGEYHAYATNNWTGTNPNCTSTLNASSGGCGGAGGPGAGFNNDGIQTRTNYQANRFKTSTNPCYGGQTGGDGMSNAPCVSTSYGGFGGGGGGGNHGAGGGGFIGGNGGQYTSSYYGGNGGDSAWNPNTVTLVSNYGAAYSPQGSVTGSSNISGAGSMRLTFIG